MLTITWWVTWTAKLNWLFIRKGGRPADYLELPRCSSNKTRRGVWWMENLFRKIAMRFILISLFVSLVIYPRDLLGILHVIASWFAEETCCHVLNSKSSCSLKNGDFLVWLLPGIWLRNLNSVYIMILRKIAVAISWTMNQWKFRFSGELMLLSIENVLIKLILVMYLSVISRCF